MPIAPDPCDHATLTIVHADDAWVLVDKPAGLLAVPGRGEAKQDCAALRVQSRWPDALVVHRLDMATSGLLLFARGAEVQRRLSRAFAERRVLKRYTAVVHGLPHPPEGEIALSLAADWPNRPRQQVDALHGKPSLTRYRVLAHDAATGLSHVELEPVTGRSHQLRVHLMAIGHPIAGDALYAPADLVAGHPRLLLHASTLQLAHPVSGQIERFENPAPF